MPVEAFSTCMKQGSDGGASDLRIQDRRTALALRGFLARDLAAGEVVFLADFVRQATVH